MAGLALGGLLAASGCTKKAAETPAEGTAADTATEPVAAAATGECWGVNECKGKGDCGGPDGSSCAGTNECKGKGWKKMTEADCKEKGGQFKAG